MLFNFKLLEEIVTISLLMGEIVLRLSDKVSEGKRNSQCTRCHKTQCTITQDFKCHCAVFVTVGYLEPISTSSKHRNYFTFFVRLWDYIILLAFFTIVVYHEFSIISLLKPCFEIEVSKVVFVFIYVVVITFSFSSHFAISPIVCRKTRAVPLNLWLWEGPNIARIFWLNQVFVAKTKNVIDIKAFPNIFCALRLPTLVSGCCKSLICPTDCVSNQTERDMKLHFINYIFDFFFILLLLSIKI